MINLKMDASGIIGAIWMSGLLVVSSGRKCSNIYVIWASCFVRVLLILISGSVLIGYLQGLQNTIVIKDKNSFKYVLVYHVIDDLDVLESLHLWRMISTWGLEISYYI